MLSIRNLRVRYGRSMTALHGVDLDVPDDGVLAVLGTNGAGKSTLLRAISGTLRLHRGVITAGTIQYGDLRIDRLDPARIVRYGVVGVPEGRQIFARMTVAENLRAGGIATKPAERAAARKRVSALFPLLDERADQRAGLLSGGEQQMLAIGRALMAVPKLLLLDEPSLGLAPKLVERIGEAVREIHAQGTAVVLVEQNASMALSVADQAVVLSVGSVALSGSTEEIAASVHQHYLGTPAPERRSLARWS
ncbi:ABC transporter ATP-binding protein [Kribbella antibiotica]|uniref:ABC transporter ATP-binding protein n=1 Tax=Kribbella antibiotica TaxID=190195 RepID=A0A4R4ZVQ6_9ACTN|nr:ABC transporter ATP-binding protein [Kribbella antibiotica]TDD63263.1 ABC transporter ATP-binding protein [Kribbella antibiotica]